ncbi:MAG TPA: D-Ala-D-Ala carboxypeptidase family metallohydrolase [Thermoanaerobaculia bacterium]
MRLFTLILAAILAGACTSKEKLVTSAPTDSTDTTASTVTIDASPPEPAPIAVTFTSPSADGKTPKAARSFVTSDVLRFAAESAEVEWSVDTAASDGKLEPASFAGAQYEAKARPKPAPSSRAKPLRYTLALQEGDRRSTFVIEQDEIDTIRQQYVDMSKKSVPKRKEFVGQGKSPRGYFSFAEIRSRDNAPYAVFTVLPRMDEWRENYGGPLRVNRGFTTPRHNARIKGAAKNSQHLYGRAVDIDSDSSDWVDKRDAARDAGACTEPLSICGYGHVHGDWRKECPPGW